jgi:Flp pilus assembly pilin Flp
MHLIPGLSSRAGAAGAFHFATRAVRTKSECAVTNVRRGGVAGERVTRRRCSARAARNGQQTHAVSPHPHRQVAVLAHPLPFLGGVNAIVATRDGRPRSHESIARHQTARGRNVMNFLIAYLRPFIRKVDGQDMIEYALLAALIAIVAVFSINATGVSVNQIWQAVAGDLGEAAAAAGGGAGGGE